MSERYTFTVPGKPQQWQRVAGKGRHSYVPKKTRTYQKKVAVCALNASVRQTDEPVHLTIALHYPDARRRDIDNGVKSIMDALEGIAYGDDRQIHRLEATKGIDRENPRAEITIETLDGGDQ